MQTGLSKLVLGTHFTESGGEPTYFFKILLGVVASHPLT